MTNSPATSEPQTVDKICPAHGGYVAKVFQIKGFPPVTGSCPTCQREHAERKEAEEIAQKQREAQIAIDRLLNASGIPYRFQGASFEDYDAKTLGQKRVRDVCQAFVEHFDKARNDGRSLVLCGRPGTGKTHLACAAVQGVIRSWQARAHFATTLQALRRIKDTYRKDSEKTESDVIDTLVGYELLVLDEVGVQLGSEHEKMLMFEVLNERYQQCQPTILISNLSKAELTDYLGERIMDRFAECGSVLAFDWQSHRGKAAA